MATEFAKIETLQLADGEELLEIVHTSLDDLWKVDDWEYPQVILDFCEKTLYTNAQLTKFFFSKKFRIDWYI